MKRIVIAGLLLAGILSFGWQVTPVSAQGPAEAPGGWQLFFPPYGSDNERLGVGLAGWSGSITSYDVAQLHAGWYLNWGTSQYPPHPAGMAYVQVVRLKGPARSCTRACNAYSPTCSGAIDYTGCQTGTPADPSLVTMSPSREGILEIVKTRPGSVWLIGNEPDRIEYMDDVCPDEYAMVYHDLYQLIKEADPTAKVTIGGIVQATPIRLQYLDIVMCSYQHTYGTQLPADLWNVHAFVLNEEEGGWGCDLPPGMVSPELAQRRALWDCDNMAIFKDQIHDFRAWMADHGERDKALIVSEYGVLMPTWLCDGDPNHDDPTGQCAPGNGRPYNESRVSAFVLNSFDYFLGVDPDGIDSKIGYPSDGNRLVQAWSWYSLNDDWVYNGNLFQSGDKQMTQIGEDYSQYAAPLIEGYVDLLPRAVNFEHPPDLLAGDPVEVAISSQAFNMGNEAAGNVGVRYWDGKPGKGTQVGSDQVVPSVPTRYEGFPTTEVNWNGVATGIHHFYVQVDPDDSIDEIDETNNTTSASLDFRPDLTVNSIAFDPSNPIIDASQSVTITIQTELANVGHLAAVNVKVDFWDGDPDSGGQKLGQKILAPSPADPFGSKQKITTQLDWEAKTSGAHYIYVRIDPDDQIEEIDEENNQLVGVVLLANHRLFIPLIRSGSLGAALPEGSTFQGTWLGSHPPAVYP